MPDSYVPGLPGVRSTRTATHKIVFKGDWEVLLPGGRIIDGSKSRDVTNTGDLDVLQCGLLMGMITASGKYAPSIFGTIDAYTSGGTSLTVSAAAATEISRRVGSSGSLNAIGPPTAAGTVAVTAVTFSAINTSTGVLTVSDLGVDKIAGTFLSPADGSQIPRTLIPDGFSKKVTDIDGSNIDVPFEMLPVAGELISANIINWPSDTSLQQWIVDKLNTYGKFVFDHMY